MALYAKKRGPYLRLSISRVGVGWLDGFALADPALRLPPPVAMAGRPDGKGKNLKLTFR